MTREIETLMALLADSFPDGGESGPPLSIAGIDDEEEGVGAAVQELFSRLLEEVSK